MPTSQQRGIARRAFTSLRVRIVLVILFSVVPLAAIASLLAWQNYQSAADRGERRVEALLVSTLAHVDAFTSDALQGAAALAHTAGITTPATCRDVLDAFLRFAPPRYERISIARADGTPVCGWPPAAGRPPAARGALTAAGRPGALLLPVGTIETAPDGTPLRIVAHLLIPTALSSGAAWLLTAHGTAAVRLAGDLRLPPQDAIARLLGGVPFITARGSGGEVHAFALGRLPDGTPLMIGDRATRSEAHASTLLFWRFAGIAVVLAAGILAVAVGAHLTVAAPIRELARRVTRWRSGGGFDESPMRFLPGELGNLLHAFGQATRRLAHREAQLQRAGAEQELLFKEIHHRVKNNLQIIASLLNLQASRIRVPEARAEFQSARDRVRALATLHRHLYADGGLHTIAMRGFLLELCGQLFQAIGEREGQRIRLEVEAPEVQMSSDQAVPLALVVTEAVSNAVKYAFPGGRSGHVRVMLTELPEDMIELVIQDDGVGIPAGRAETETGIRDGLGIQLIRGFARQLGAELEVTEDGGTRYRLRLKLRRDHHEGTLSDPALS